MLVPKMQNSQPDWALRPFFVLRFATLWLMLPACQPLPVVAKPRPFDGADWIFELKYDGFRALAYIEARRLPSRLPQRPRFFVFHFPGHISYPDPARSGGDSRWRNRVHVVWKIHRVQPILVLIHPFSANFHDVRHGEGIDRFSSPGHGSVTRMDVPCAGPDLRLECVPMAPTRAPGTVLHQPRETNLSEVLAVS